MSEFSEKMGMAAGNNFKSGYNCCEAIVETFRKEAGVNIDDNAFRLCSGFGGGIGHARDLCGAMAGCNYFLLFIHLADIHCTQGIKRQIYSRRNVGNTLSCYLCRCAHIDE